KVQKTDTAISSMVVVRERETMFKNIAIPMRTAPKMACSFQESGRMSSGHSAAMAARAQKPRSNDCRYDTHPHRGTDPVTRFTSTIATWCAAGTLPQPVENLCLACGFWP